MVLTNGLTTFIESGWDRDQANLLLLLFRPYMSGYVSVRRFYLVFTLNQHSESTVPALVAGLTSSLDKHTAAWGKLSMLLFWSDGLLGCHYL